MRRSALLARSRRTSATLAAFVLLTGGLAACSKGHDAGDALSDFLTGWHSGNLDKVGFVTAAGGAVTSASVVTQLQTLTGDLTKAPLVLSKQGDPKVTGDNAAGTITLKWTLANGAVWSYPSAVKLTKANSDGWKVVWDPSIVNSKLTAGDKLALRSVPAARAAILDATGAALVKSQPVVTIGVSPEKITDLPGLTKSLKAAFKKIKVDLDLSGLKNRVSSADPGDFLDLITLRRADYNKIRDDVRPLKGTVFQESTRMLAPSRQFARALLGTVDPATRDDVDAHPGTITASDSVGHGGLEEKYDATLRGTSGLSVVIARKSPENATVVDTQLFSTQPVPGTPIKTTLNVKAQNAADAAVATEKKPSALVAIKISDSSVLAVSNGPDGAGVDTALTGQVPPGSTFKVVSALGLLTKKAVTPATTVNCPKTKTVSGHVFKNAAGEALGNVPFSTDFAKSCNTAFIGLGPKLGADGLNSAATSVGLGGQWDLGLPVFTGKISKANSATELAQAMFGQGTTVVSPMAMAGATAAVERGKFQQPQLVTTPAPAQPAPDGAPLDSAAVSALHTLMRDVVTKGTGTGLRNVPGKPVYGKTGTAEIDESSDATHAWFVGWQGDVAFAVLVQKGGAGAAAAVPIVDKFLKSMNK